MTRHARVHLSRSLPPTGKRRSSQLLLETLEDRVTPSASLGIASLNVTDAGGPYSGSTYPASATVNGNATLEGIPPTLTYFSGTYTNVSQLAGLTPLSGAHGGGPLHGRSGLPRQ